MKKNAEIRRVQITKVAIFSTFSVIEGGLLTPSFDQIEKPDRRTGEKKKFSVPVLEAKRKQWCGKVRLRDRKNTSESFWINGEWVGAEELARQKCKRRRRAKGLVPMAYTRDALVLRYRDDSRPEPGVVALCGDTGNLIAGSLAKCGKVIRLLKRDVGKNISDMGRLWQHEPEVFLRYACRDAIISAQVAAFFAKKFEPLSGGVLCMRIAKYSERHFKSLFQQIFYEYRTGIELPVSKATGALIHAPNAVWRPPMGYRPVTIHKPVNGVSFEEYIRSLAGDAVEPGFCPKTLDQLVDHLIAEQEKQGSNAVVSFKDRERIKGEIFKSYREKYTVASTFMVPTPGVSMFLPFCIGGRAECWTVGMATDFVYADLKSAFVSALLLLPDYDYSQCYTTTGPACMNRFYVLLPLGSFLNVGLEVSYVFKSGVEPRFPLRTEGKKFKGQKIETIIYPASGSGPIMWTEFYAAYTADLFESFIIHSIVEFKALGTYRLATRIRELLTLRRDDENGVIKAILNLFFGKTLQGYKDVRDNIFDVTGLSSISCFPLAAFMLGVCRGVIGEIVHLNTCHAIASDAALIAGHGPVNIGPLARAIQKEMTPLGYTFVEIEFMAEQGIFLRSRGYLLSGYKVKNGVVSKKKTLKIANMGMKTDRKRDAFDPDLLGPQQVDDFMTGLITGRLRCYNFMSFSHLKDEYQKNKEQREELQRALRNSRNTQSRLRQASGISSARLEVEYERLSTDQSFREYEQDRLTAFIAAGGTKADALAQVLTDYEDLRRQYEEVAGYQIFSRRYFYTVGVNHTFDFKRVPIANSIKPVTIEFDYGSSDGTSLKHYKFHHVSFATRPLYSAAEYQQLIQAATYRMEPQAYIAMLEDLEAAGVLSNYYQCREQAVETSVCDAQVAIIKHLTVDDKEK